MGRVNVFLTDELLEQMNEEAKEENHPQRADSDGFGEVYRNQAA
jgi:hypothetical protein